MAEIDKEVEAFQEETRALFTRGFFQRKLGFGNESLRKHCQFINNYRQQQSVTLIQTPQILLLELMQKFGATDLDEKNTKIWTDIKMYLSNTAPDNDFNLWKNLLQTIESNTRLGFESELDPKVSNALDIIRNVITPKVKQYDWIIFKETALEIFDDIKMTIRRFCGWTTRPRPAVKSAEANYCLSSTCLSSYARAFTSLFAVRRAPARNQEPSANDQHQNSDGFVADSKQLHKKTKQDNTDFRSRRTGPRL